MKSNVPTVYIVDDDDAVRDALGALLESVSQRYQSFASAEAFLEVAHPDMRGCLLLDVRMPGMSGLVLHQKLQEQGVTLPDRHHHRTWRRADGGSRPESRRG